MEQAELLKFIVDAFERCNVCFAVTGSHASMAYGENRFTNDIDIITQMTLSQLPAFLAQFPYDDFYVNDVAAADAVNRGGQFNIIHQRTSQKIDVYVPREPDWPDHFPSRVQMPVNPQFSTWFISPSDLILRKMKFYEEGGSDKHLRDIASMLVISGDLVDFGYVDSWAKKLGLDDIWKLILTRVRK